MHVLDHYRRRKEWDPRYPVLTEVWDKTEMRWVLSWPNRVSPKDSDSHSGLLSVPPYLADFGRHDRRAGAPSGFVVVFKR